MSREEVDAEYELILSLAREAADTPRPSNGTSGPRRRSFWEPARVREAGTASSAVPQPLLVSSTYRQGKVSDDLCEDLVVASPDGSGLSAVFDGATDKSGLRFELDGRAVSGGRFAAHVLGRALADLDPSVSARQAVDALSAALALAVEQQHPGLSAGMRPLATAAVYSPARAEVWLIGDAQVGIETLDGDVEVLSCPMRLDGVKGARRAARLAELEASGTPWDGTGEDPGRAEIMDLLRIQGALANTDGPYGFGVLDGVRVPGVRLHVVSVADARRLVLASDGYPEVAVGGRLDRDLAERRLSELLREDPLCVLPGKLQGSKGLDRRAVAEGRSFDDRSWLELSR